MIPSKEIKLKKNAKAKVNIDNSCPRFKSKKNRLTGQAIFYVNIKEKINKRETCLEDKLTYDTKRSDYTCEDCIKWRLNEKPKLFLIERVI